MKTSIPLLLLTLFAFADTAETQGPTALIDADADRGGWSFDNGKEFPGAKGSLQLAGEPHRGQPVLALQGDFTGGGQYVQAATELPDVPVQTLWFWINLPAGSDSVPVRLIDGSGQCHQLRLKLNDKGGWQKVVLPVEEYFRKMGTADALDLTTQYQKWSGADDGQWHQPGRLFVVLCTRHLGEQPRVLLSDVQLEPSPPKTEIRKTVRLDEVFEAGETGWEFNRGAEYPGAGGGLELVADQPEQGQRAMRLHGDFTGGGAYVGVRRSFDSMNIVAMPAIRMKMRSETVGQFAVRLVDATGQAHQRKGVPLKPDGEWHEVAFIPTEIAGGEHWGGANDGKWHGPARLIEIMLNTRSHEGNQPAMLMADLRADIVIEATAAETGFNDPFESAEAFQRGWQTRGDVTFDQNVGQSERGALALKRSLDTIQKETHALSSDFAVQPGVWKVSYAARTDLHSPDNSYHGRVALELLNASGGVVETAPIGISTGRGDWQSVSEAVTVPDNAARARLRIELNKTYGVFHVDDLSATRLKVQPVEQRVERVLISSDVLGNLFQPDTEIVFNTTIEAGKPLPTDTRTLRYTVRDYWGAAQLDPGEVTLVPQPRRQGRFVYSAQITLPTERIAEGRFHELHVSIPQGIGEPATEYVGFAVLPTAATKQHDPEAVPFTIRNWDSRVTEYVHLADRLGIRVIGLWGGWSPRPPYEPHCPRLELCNELGAKWITGTPAAQIERNGFDRYSEESLRAGMRNFLQAYADKGLSKIAMGNEPHGAGEKVLENVRAYRAIYETVKAFDGDVHVIGTSVEPNEEYFKAGYQNYLDSYDFHIYEHYSKVRQTMREYRALMEKYDAVKPINSTELGLNSQGQTRLAVSREMVKKITSFFAEGGNMVAWFTILYPDPQGKARGQFGDSHCMFDSKYNLYNPRLDAVTHYHLVNAIGIKKFVAEKHYANGAQAYLFRDKEGRCVQVLWLDEKREDVFVPMPGVGQARLIHVDGTQQQVRPADGGVTLTLGDDPLLLLYDNAAAALPDRLGKPTLSLAATPEPVRPGQSTSFLLNVAAAERASIRVLCPPLWKASIEHVADGKTRVHIKAPRSTPAREARVRVQLIAGDAAKGEVQVLVPVAQPRR